MRLGLNNLSINLSVHSEFILIKCFYNSSMIFSFVSLSLRIIQAVSIKLYVLQNAHENIGFLRYSLNFVISCIRKSYSLCTIQS